MKKLLFSGHRPREDWSRGKRGFFWSWNILLVLLTGMELGILSQCLTSRYYAGYLAHPLTVALNLLPAVVLNLLLYGLIGRAQISFLLTALVTLGLSAGNYFKLAFRDDPLMFGDLMYLREASRMAGEYQLFWSAALGKALLCALGSFLLLWLLARGRPRGRMRVSLTLAGLACAAALVPVLTSGSLYDRTAHYEELEHRWSATEQYLSHGFLYPFLHSISDTVETAPTGYHSRDAAALMEQYADADIPEEQKVNFVGIMLEAYNDFTRFDIPQMNPEVYAVWHQLEQEGYAGNLVTNIFAGGTVDTERGFLTGYSNWINYRGDVNAYPWYFRQQGYRVEGMHPSNQWFYNRVNVNAYLGFERYRFTEDYFYSLANWDTAGDDIFFPALLREYEAATADETPYFNFSVTYQGHGPYPDAEYVWAGDPADVLSDDGSLTEEQYYIFANYLASVQNTNDNLKVFTDYLRTDEEPVVLILFGDHNPWLGDGNEVYEALDVDFSMDTRTGFLNYYSTRYIIWANDAAKEILEEDFQGQGPDLGPYFLMNQVFRLCGWAGPAYMQAIDPIAREVPVVHVSGSCMEDGEIVTELSQRGQTLVSDYNRLQYYWRRHFAYGKED